MKKLSIAICLFTALGVYSCKKESPSPKTTTITPISVVGTWNVVSDSTSSSVGAIDYTTGAKYIGKSGDYFHFTSDGNLFAKEGSVLLDTAAYFIKDKQLSLTYKYLFQNGTTITSGTGGYAITTITEHSLMLAKQLLGPGGFYFEYIVLSK